MGKTSERRWVWFCFGLLPAIAHAADLFALRGPALRAALHAQVRGHTVIPYASSRWATADALRQLAGAIGNTLTKGHIARR